MEENNNFSEFQFVEKRNLFAFQKHRDLCNVLVKVKVNKAFLNVHKGVLEQASPVLKAMLSQIWCKDEKIIELKEFVDSEILEDLINYFYTAQITFTPQNVCSICVASHFLQIPALLSASERFLILNVSPSNVMDFLKFANNFDLINLRERCREYFYSNKQFRNDGKMLKMGKEEFAEKLKRMKTNKDEDPSYYEEKFYLVRNWINLDKENRAKECYFYFLFAELEKTSIQFLDKIVRFDDIFGNNCISKYLLKHYRSEILKHSRNFVSFPKSSYLYCLGGNNESSTKGSSSVSRFDSVTNEWISLPETQIGKFDFSAIAIKEKIYVFGGDTQDGIVTEDCEYYDYEYNTWMTIKPMHIGRKLCGVAEYCGDLYVFYGMNGFGKFLNNAERYSLWEDEWTLFEFQSNPAPPEVEIHYRFLGIHNHVCYCLLAEKEKNARGDNYMKALIKGFHMKSFKEKASRDVTNLFKLNSIEHISTTMHNGTIFFQNQECFSYLHIDSEVSHSIPTSTYQFGQFLIFFDDKLLRVGGAYDKDGREYSNDMDQFDAKKACWGDYRKMDVPRMNHSCVVVNH